MAEAEEDPHPFAPSTMSAKQTIQLNNGVSVPIIGSGSWAPAKPEAQAKVKDWILSALKNGFRHIDTAQGYGTEKAVGEAIRASGIPREEIFVTTKLPWNHNHRVRESFEQSLKNLNVGHIDLYLLHWPQAIAFEEGNDLPKNPDGTYKTTDSTTFNDTWAEIEKLLDTGKVRAIGVSNFSIKTLEQLFKTAKITPAVNQVEMHPYLAQNELRDYCAQKGIVITAYSPSGYSNVRSDPLIVSLAEKYKVSSNQIIFAWHISRGTIIVPKSENNERQKENIAIPTLSPEDLGKIWTLDRGQRLCNKADPVHKQVWGWTYEQLGWEDYRPKL
ncbi:reductase AKOR2 [Crassisporium funariophilum]|nr:reductase AKOR2 [Crassisporium funariophilum]